MKDKDQPIIPDELEIHGFPGHSCPNIRILDQLPPPPTKPLRVSLIRLYPLLPTKKQPT